MSDEIGQETQVSGNGEAQANTGGTPAQSQDGGQQIGGSPPASTTKPQGDKDAGSPPATGEGEQQPRETSFEALQKHYEKIQGKQPDAEKAGTGQEGAEPNAQATGQDQSDDPNDSTDLLGTIPRAEWAVMKGKTRRRIGAYRAKLQELTQHFEASKEKIAAHDQLDSYLKRNNLTSTDVNYAMDLIVALNTDPVRAKEALQPLIDYVNGQTGETLPPDIQVRVDNGEISMQAGKELAAARASQARGERKNQEREQQEQAQRQAEEMQRQWSQGTNKLTTAIASWEAQWKANDPDYEQMKPRVAARIKRVLAQSAKGGVMPSPKEAVQLAEEIRNEVKEDFRASQPRPGNQQVVQGGTVRNARPEPKSSHEAVLRAYESMRQRSAA